jgi:hypothetical protein
MGVMNLALKMILDILPQLRVRDQLYRLGPLGYKLRLPLRNGCPVVELATARGSVTGQLPGNG